LHLHAIIYKVERVECNIKVSAAGEFPIKSACLRVKAKFSRKVFLLFVLMSKNALYEQDESSGGSEVKLNVMELIGVKLIKVSSKIDLCS